MSTPEQPVTEASTEQQLCVTTSFGSEAKRSEGDPRSYILGVEVSGFQYPEGNQPTREEALYTVARFAADALGYELIPRPEEAK